MAERKKSAPQTPAARATAPAQASLYLIQQGTELHIIESEEYPDLTVPAGEKIKKVIGRSPDRATLMKIVERQKKHLRMTFRE